MTRDDVAAVAEANLGPLTEKLGLKDWRIEVAVGRIEGTPAGEIQVRAAYERAHITLDPDAFEGESDVIETLRHELIHAFCWPMHAFAGTFDEMASEHFEAWTFFNERMVRNVERLLDEDEA